MALKQAAKPTQPIIDAFRLGLTDTTAGGRYTAADGLVSLRDQLSDEQWTKLVPDIQKAAIGEPHGLAAEQVGDIHLAQAAHADPAAA